MIIKDLIKVIISNQRFNPSDLINEVILLFPLSDQYTYMPSGYLKFAMFMYKERCV